MKSCRMYLILFLIACSGTTAIAATPICKKSNPRPAAQPLCDTCLPSVPCRIVSPSSDTCVTSIKSGDLQIRLGGLNRETAEIYFGEAEFCQYTFPSDVRLCASHFVIARQDGGFGAFAVRTGKCANTLFLFARIPRTQEWTTVCLAFSDHTPVSIEWITSRLLRIRHGTGLEQTMVVRVDESNDMWKQLSPKPGTIGSVAKWNADSLKWE